MHSLSLSVPLALYRNSAGEQSKPFSGNNSYRSEFDAGRNGKAKQTKGAEQWYTRAKRLAGRRQQEKNAHERRRSGKNKPHAHS